MATDTTYRAFSLVPFFQWKTSSSRTSCALVTRFSAYAAEASAFARATPIDIFSRCALLHPFAFCTPVIIRRLISAICWSRGFPFPLRWFQSYEIPDSTAFCITNVPACVCNCWNNFFYRILHAFCVCKLSPACILFSQHLDGSCRISLRTQPPMNIDCSSRKLPQRIETGSHSRNYHSFGFFLFASSQGLQGRPSL